MSVLYASRNWDGRMCSHVWCEGVVVTSSRCFSSRPQCRGCLGCVWHVGHAAAFINRHRLRAESFGFTDVVVVTPALTLVSQLQEPWLRSSIGRTASYRALRRGVPSKACSRLPLLRGESFGRQPRLFPAGSPADSDGVCSRRRHAAMTKGVRMDRDDFPVQRFFPDTKVMSRQPPRSFFVSRTAK